MKHAVSPKGKCIYNVNRAPNTAQEHVNFCHSDHEELVEQCLKDNVDSGVEFEVIKFFCDS
jgi:hypothetical protein